MSSVNVQGETYQSSDELLDSIAELERARDNSPEYGPQRPRIDAHLTALRRALRTLKEKEAAASDQASARAERDTRREAREVDQRATAKASSRAASSKRRRDQTRAFTRGSRRDVSRFAGATGIDQPIGNAGDFALNVIGWTLLVVLFFVLIKPGGKGPKTVAAFSGGTQKFLDRLLDPSKPLVNYSATAQSPMGGPQKGASTPAATGAAAPAGYQGVSGVAGPVSTASVLVDRAKQLVGSAKATIIGKPNVKGSTHDPNATPNNWESDNAYDIAVPNGTPVYAASNGTIGSQIGSLGSSGRFEGIRLHLVTAGNEFYYAHLSRLAPGIKAGSKVTAGDLLGYSGVANGVAHLHFASKAGDPLLG